MHCAVECFLLITLITVSVLFAKPLNQLASTEEDLGKHKLGETFVDSDGDIWEVTSHPCQHLADSECKSLQLLYIVTTESTSQIGVNSSTEVNSLSTVENDSSTIDELATTEFTNESNTEVYSLSTVENNSNLTTSNTIDEIVTTGFYTEFGTESSAKAKSLNTMITSNTIVKIVATEESIEKSIMPSTVRSSAEEKEKSPRESFLADENKPFWAHLGFHLNQNSPPLASFLPMPSSDAIANLPRADWRHLFAIIVAVFLVYKYARWVGYFFTYWYLIWRLRNIW